MADKLDNNISKELKRITRTSPQPRFPVMTGVVKVVDTAGLKCNVVLGVDAADNQTPGIMLNASLQTANGFVLYPKVDSAVWVAEIDGPGKWGLIKCSELDQVIITIAATKFTITDTGFKIEKGSVSLTSIMQNIINHILQITVPTGTGPSGMPNNASSFNSDLSDINNLLF